LVDRLCTDLFFSARARERDDNLIFVRERLLRNEADLASLLDLYLKIRQGNRVMDDEFDPLINLLRLSGVAHVSQGRLHVRNRIYSRVFDEEWVRSNLPEAELRRQREAYRRGVIWATSVSFVGVLVIGLLIFSIVRQRASAALAYFSQARTERMSGRPGQRVASLTALQKAHLYHANEMELRNEAIASLALVDLEKVPFLSDFPSNTTSIAINHLLTQYALGDDRGNIRLFDVADRRTGKQLGAAGMPVSWIALSPSGKFLAAQYDSGDKHRLTIWDGESKRVILSFTNRVLQSALDFSADSSKLAIGFPDGHVSVFSLPDGNSLVSLPLRVSIAEPQAPACIRFDPSGNRLAVSSRDSYRVQVWDLITSVATHDLSHRSSVIAMAWHPEGSQLATASEYNDLYLWDLRFSKRREFVQAHSDTVIDLVFSPRGDLLASLGLDMALKLWTPATGRHMTHFVESELSDRLRFSKDGLRLVHVAVKPGLAFWEVLGAGEYRVFRAPGEFNAAFTSLCFGPEGRVLITANDLGAFLWDTATGGALSFLRLAPTRSAFAHPTRGDLFTSSAYGFYRWPRSSAETRESLILKFGPSKCLDLPAGLGRSSISGPGGRAAVVHEDHIHLIKLDEPFSNDLLPAKGQFQTLAMSPDGNWLVAWTQSENAIQLWAIDKPPSQWQPAKILRGSRHFAFSPDSKFLVTCWQRAYHVWEIGTWIKQETSIPRSRAGDPHGPVAIAPGSAKGRAILAVADSPTTIKLFEVVSGNFAPLRDLATFESPERKPLLGLVFNGDGSRLAAAATDQTVGVWDLSRIREGLARIGLAGDIPTFPARLERPLSVVFESDTLDMDSPQQWQKVEMLTTALEKATNNEPVTVSKIFSERGELLIKLGQAERAKADFDQALRLTRDEASFRESIRDTNDMLRKESTTPQ
jgi:WD40 repeat protein